MSIPAGSLFCAAGVSHPHGGGAGGPLHRPGRGPAGRGLHRQ